MMDWTDRAGKVKHHQYLTAVKQSVQYRMPYRPAFKTLASQQSRVAIFLWRLPRIAAYYANLRGCMLSIFESTFT